MLTKNQSTIAYASKYIIFILNLHIIMVFSSSPGENGTVIKTFEVYLHTLSAFTEKEKKKKD